MSFQALKSLKDGFSYLFSSTGLLLLGLWVIVDIFSVGIFFTLFFVLALTLPGLSTSTLEPTMNGAQLSANATGASITFIILFFVIMLLFALIQYVMMYFIVRHIAEDKEFIDFDLLSGSLRGSLHLFLGMIFISLSLAAFGLIMALLGFASFSALGLVGGIIIGIILGLITLVVMAIALISIALFPYLIIEEKKGVFSAFKESIRLTKGHRLPLFGIYLLVMLINIVLNGLLLPIMFILALIPVLGGIVSNIISIVISDIVLMIVLFTFYKAYEQLR